MVVITVEMLEETCVVTDSWDEDGAGMLDSELVVESVLWEALEVTWIAEVEDELLDGTLDGTLELSNEALGGLDGV